MEGKEKWYKSKTVWAGVVTTLLGVYALAKDTVAPMFGVNLPPIPEGVFVFLGALGVYGRTTATKKIG